MTAYRLHTHLDSDSVSADETHRMWSEVLDIEWVDVLAAIEAEGWCGTFMRPLPGDPLVRCVVVIDLDPGLCKEALAYLTANQ